MITDAQLQHWFTYHHDGEKAGRYDAINQAALDFAKIIRDLTPACADQTHAIRMVRDARMWANAAIACDGV